MTEYYLNEILEIKNGKDHKSLLKGSIPVYGSGGLMRYVNKSIYDKESILLPRKGTLANIQYANKPFWTVDTLYFSIVNEEKADVYYLYNYLKILDLSKLNSGTGVPSMTFGAYYSVKVQLPNLSVQKEISKVLSDLDAKIETNNKINKDLEAMAKLLYDYWFVQFDFPYSPPSEGCPQDGVAIGKPYKSSGGKMVYNDELKREIPEGWENGTFDNLGSIIGGSTPSKNENDNFCINGMPWITPKDLSLNTGKKFITKGELDASEKGVKNASLKIFPEGTVLLSSRAPVGYMVIARNNLTTNQGFKSFVPNKGYSTAYIYYSVQSNMKVIEQNASGSTFKEISGGVLKSIKICLAEKNIREMFDEKVNSIFKRQNLLELENQKLTELRDWLLPMLMNGQVTVGEAAAQLGMVAEGRETYKN